MSPKLTIVPFHAPFDLDSMVAHAFSVGFSIPLDSSNLIRVDEIYEVGEQLLALALLYAISSLFFQTHVAMAFS